MINLIPQTLENRAAIRTAFAAVVAIVLAFFFHLPKPYWAGMTVVVLANIYTGNVIDKALMRITGTIIGAWLGYFIAGYVANSFFLYLLASFFFVTIAVYYYNFSNYAYAYLLGAIAAFIVLSEIALDPDEAFFVAIWRPVEIGLGVLVSAAAAFCLFPNTVKNSMEQQTTAIFTDVDALLAKIGELIINKDSSLTHVIYKDTLALKRKLRKAVEMIGFMRREVGFSHQKIDQFRLVLDSFYNLCRMINFYLASSQWETTQDNTVFKDIFTVFHEDLEQLRRAFTSTGKQTFSLDHVTAMQQFNQQETRYLNQPLGVTHFIRQTSRILTNLATVFNGKEIVAKKGRGLFSHQDQLRNDSDVIIHSMKAGLAATLALVFWLLSNWPGGLNGIISSIIISIRKNLFEMKNVSLHRLLGCLLGGGLALFSLTFVAMDLYDFLWLIFMGVWGFSYFSFKKVPYAYIGLQANLALIITLAQEGGPPISLAPPLERLGGIIIGITASFIVANGFWRTDLWKTLEGQMEKLKRNLAQNGYYLLHPGTKTKSLYAISNLFWLTRGVIETLEKENLSVSRTACLSKATTDYEALVVIQATLRHIHDTVDQDSACDYAQLSQINLSHLAEHVAQCYQQRGCKNKEAILQALNEALQHFLQQPRQQRATLDEIENCNAYIQALIQLMTCIDALAI